MMHEREWSLFSCSIEAISKLNESASNLENAGEMEARSFLSPEVTSVFTN